MQAVIGVDQSTRCSGWAIVDREGNIVDFGILKSPAKLKGLEAAIWQTDGIEAIALGRGIKQIAMEELHLGGKTAPPTVFLLGALQGMLIHSAVAMGIGWQLVSSADVCAHLGISPFSARDAKKRASRQIAAVDLWQDRTRWQEVPEDAADAIAIAMIAHRRLKVAEMIE